MFRGWYYVERRALPDPASKPVDRHITPALGIMLTYHERGAPSRDKFLEIVLARMRRVRASTVKRVRDRDFSVWYGRFTSSYGDDLVALILPDELDIRVYRCFADLTRLPAFVEQGTGAPADAHAAPLARYEHGALVAYLPPTRAGDLRDDEVEARSASVQAPSTPSPRHVLAVPNYVAPRRHDLDSWKEAHAAALRWVWDCGAPGTYGRLRQIVDASFGVTVCEHPALPNGGFGMLQTSWMDVQETVPVKILIRADLARDLKYVVLAHEFAHFVLHFPVIRQAQQFEDVARVVPEITLLLAQSVERHLLRDTMELHADVFASNLLIPAQVDFRRWAEFITEGHAPVSAEEYAWRYLTKLFPDTAGRPDGWSEYHEMREMARLDIATVRQHAPERLFEQMLRAMVFRIGGGTEELSKTVGSAMGAVIIDMEELTGELIALDIEQARELARERLQDMGADAVEFDGAGTYEPIHPRAADRRGPFQFVALVPAPDNFIGDRDGGWIDHHHPDDGAATIADWLERIPDDVGLRLYGRA
jgi:hypothetical protein